MSFTFNTVTNIGKVRVLIGDTTQATALLSDEEINVTLGLTSNDIYLASAISLKSIAANKAAIAKRIKAGNYEEDPKAVVSGLLEIAKNYEERSRMTPADADTEIFYTDFNYNDILIQKALRGEIND